MQFATQGFAMRSIAAVHESAFGTKRTSEADGSMSAFGGKEDIAQIIGLLLTQSGHSGRAPF
jgi:hypothetical protein